MAISIVGFNSVDAFGPTISLDLSGISQQADDVLYVIGAVNGSSAPSPSLTTTGFTILFTGAQSANRTALFRKVVGGTPDTSIACVGNGSNQYNYVGIVFRGVDPDSPEDATTTSDQGGSGAPDSPSITTTTDNAMVVSIGTVSSNDSAVTDPSGYTRITGISKGSQSTYAAQKTVSPAGAEDPGAWSGWSGTWIAFSLALKPAPSLRIVNLAGVSAAGVAGMLGKAISPTIVGVAASGHASSVEFSVLKALTGVSVTAAAGTLDKTISPQMTGASATGAAGSFAITTLKTLTGVAATGQVGTFTPEVLFSLLGVEGAMALGALVADTATRINLVGVSATGSAGTFAAAVEILLAGNGMTGDVGELASEVSVALQGVAAQMGVGDFTISDGWTKVGGQVGTVWTNAPDTPTVWTDVPGSPTTWTPKH
jgi:hypothetical protein